MKPQSYPFLAIAKKYNVDYSDVLKHADRILYRRGDYTFSIFSEIERDIIICAAEFRQIRNNRIDWMTGEKI